MGDRVTVEPAAALRDLMARRSLTQREVAVLAQVSVKTVESWLAGPSSSNYRRMPARALSLVLLSLPAFLKKRGKT